MSTLASRTPSILRLWDPGQEPASPPATAGTQKISPWMTLGEFFERYFLPVVALGERDNRESTIRVYRDAVAWWARLTGDPPLAQIDAYAIAEFQRALRVATYKRSPYGREWPLKPFTQRKIVRSLRAIFYRVGPTADPDRPAAELLERRPALKMPAEEKRTAPKPCFALDEARRIYAACELLTWGDSRRTRPPTVPASDWFRGWSSSMFFTGLRSGTVLNLNWGMVAERSDGPWLEIPGWAVTKTRKAIDMPLHAAALADLEKLRRTSRPDEPLLPWPYSYEHLAVMHARLQQLAGITKEHIKSPQAWRRTHATEMGRLGAEDALRVAQRSLDHADARTTSAHYVDLSAYLIRRLPLLRTEASDAAAQLRLF